MTLLNLYLIRKRKRVQNNLCFSLSAQNMKTDSSWFEAAEEMTSLNGALWRGYMTLVRQNRNYSRFLCIRTVGGGNFRHCRM